MGIETFTASITGASPPGACRTMIRSGKRRSITEISVSSSYVDHHFRCCTHAAIALASGSFTSILFSNCIPSPLSDPDSCLNPRELGATANVSSKAVLQGASLPTTTRLLTANVG